MRAVRVATEDGTYRCVGCGARWSYDAVRYVALCPECASGLVRLPDPDPQRRRPAAAKRPEPGR